MGLFDSLLSSTPSTVVGDDTHTTDASGSDMWGSTWQSGGTPPTDQSTTNNVNLSSPDTQEALSHLSSIGMDTAVPAKDTSDPLSTQSTSPVSPVPETIASPWDVPQGEVNTSILSATPLVEDLTPKGDTPASAPLSDIDSSPLFGGMTAVPSTEPPKVDEWTQSNTMDMWRLSDESGNSVAETGKETSSASPLSADTDALYGLAGISGFMAADEWDVLTKSKEILKKSLGELEAIVGDLESNKAEKMKIIEEAKSQEKDAREKVKKLEWELESVEAMIQLFHDQLDKEHSTDEVVHDAGTNPAPSHGKKARKS